MFIIFLRYFWKVEKTQFLAILQNTVMGGLKYFFCYFFPNTDLVFQEVSSHGPNLHIIMLNDYELKLPVRFPCWEKEMVPALLIRSHLLCPYLLSLTKFDHGFGYPYMPVFAQIVPFLPVFTSTSPSLPMFVFFTHLYPFLPAFTYISMYLPVFAQICLYLPVFSPMSENQYRWCQFEEVLLAQIKAKFPDVSATLLICLL